MLGKHLAAHEIDKRHRLGRMVGGKGATAVGKHRDIDGAAMPHRTRLGSGENEHGARNKQCEQGEGYQKPSTYHASISVCVLWLTSPWTRGFPGLHPLEILIK